MLGVKMITKQSFFDTYIGITVKMIGVYLIAIVVLNIVCKIMNTIYPFQETLILI